MRKSVVSMFAMTILSFYFGIHCLDARSLMRHKKLIELDKSIGGGNGESQCDSSSIKTYKYLMVFQTCEGDVCHDPRNHVIHLAGSDDGTNWSLIEEFEPLAGSVPDLVFYNNYLYIFHTKGSSEYNWHKLNVCFEVVDAGSAKIDGPDFETGGFVDPSMIVFDNQLGMFYLPGVIGSDPAGCQEYPCTKEIHSAVNKGVGLEFFTQLSGSRALAELGEEIMGFSDPDIVVLSDGTFLLYVSSGANTLVYQGTELDGTFTCPVGSEVVMISKNSGGVPSAIQAPDGFVWLYVSFQNTIRRAVSADGILPIGDKEFSTVIDYTISQGFSEEIHISSPSIITWPEWSNTSTTTTTTIDRATTTTSVPSCPTENIYGEYSEETEILRYLRDVILGHTPEGQEIIRLYYQWSPVIVKAMQEDEKFKEEVKELIDGILELFGGEVE